MPNAVDDALYTITIAGLYKAQVPGAPNGQGISKPYEVDVIIDHATLTEHGPLSPFKRGLCGERIMPDKYPDFIHLETFHVVKSECDQPELVKRNIHLLNFDALKLYIKETDLPVNPLYYKTAEDLRTAITECQKDPVGYQSTERFIAKKYGSLYATKAKLEQLNQRKPPEVAQPAGLPDKASKELADSSKKSLKEV